MSRHDQPEVIRDAQEETHAYLGLAIEAAEQLHERLTQQGSPEDPALWAALSQSWAKIAEVSHLVLPMFQHAREAATQALETLGDAVAASRRVDMAAHFAGTAYETVQLPDQVPEPRTGGVVSVPRGRFNSGANDNLRDLNQRFEEPDAYTVIRALMIALKRVHVELTPEVIEQVAKYDVRLVRDANGQIRVSLGERRLAEPN